MVVNDEIDDFPGDDDDMDLNYMPDDGDALDVENDCVVEADEVFDSDDDEEIEEQNATEDTFLDKNDSNIGVRLGRHNIVLVIKIAYFSYICTKIHSESGQIHALHM